MLQTPPVVPSNVTTLNHSKIEDVFNFDMNKVNIVRKSESANYIEQPQIYQYISSMENSPRWTHNFVFTGNNGPY